MNLSCPARRSALILTVLSIGGIACPRPAGAIEATGDLRVWTDYTAFRMGAGASSGYVEFYIELKRADLEFRVVDSVLRADVHTWVHVTDSTGAPYDSVGGGFIAAVRDSAELADRDFTVFFARALELPSGIYQARVVVTDLVDKSSSEARFAVRVPSFPLTDLAVSGIQLGYEVFQVPTDSLRTMGDVLVKNGYKVYPDCRGLVGRSRPNMFFYLEVYNLDFDPARDNSYTVEFTVIPTDGTPSHSLGRQTLTKPGPSAVLASSIPVRDIAAGLYQLRVEVTDPVTGQSAAAEKRFQVVLPPADTLTAEEVQRLTDIIAYIARPTEMTTFKRLNSAGKRNFMIQFWKRRDPTPETPVNEFREEHMRRLNYANEHFSIGFKDRRGGWNRDRGRVYIVYGPPDLNQRYPFTPDQPPAEQWVYDNLPGQGQAYFLFVDERGFGDYRLVHSSARGERRDPYWEDLVAQGVFDRMR